MKNYNTKKSKFLIILAGPTAVGKTSLSIQLAKKYNAEIFSCDSRQLYKELNIGTAKPDSAEMDGIPHHFIDSVSIETPYNAGQFERDFDQLQKAYFENHDVAIMTGGTGMYIKAALEGLDEFPEVDEDVQIHYQQLLKKEGIEVLQEELKQLDPEYAEKVDLNNHMRLLRALSVIKSSGHPYSYYLNKRNKKSLPFTPIYICLTRSRDELYDRINLRVDQMIEKGLLNEVKGLQSQQHLKALQTVGYSEFFDYFNGETDLETAVELIKRNSRRYAKRQLTWFRNQGNYAMLPAENKEAVLEYIEKKMQ